MLAIGRGQKGISACCSIQLTQNSISEARKSELVGKLTKAELHSFLHLQGRGSAEVLSGSSSSWLLLCLSSSRQMPDGSQDA